MDIAIIGYGIVGKATHASVLQNHQDVHVYDLDRRYDVSRAHDMIFVCLPTSDQAEVDQLRSLCLQILQSHEQTWLCVRSSVPVGTLSQDLAGYHDRVIYFPEFLRERRWLQDALAGEWVIGCNTDARAVMSPWCANNKAHYVSLVEAEIVKMMANCYAAMNVVFANHVYELSQKMKADYGAVQAAHDRIRHRDQNYLSVTSELRGFGGKCLPKDLDFLIDTFARFGLQQDLFNSIRQDNRLWPTTVRQDT